MLGKDFPTINLLFKNSNHYDLMIPASVPGHTWVTKFILFIFMILALRGLSPSPDSQRG
jgi:hypothetical protein